MDTKLFLDTVADMTWSDFLEPRGLARKELVIDTDNARYPGMYYLQGEIGHTSFRAGVPMSIEVYVDAHNNDLGELAQTVAHELTHAALPHCSHCDPHTDIPAFGEIMHAMGAVGDLHSTEAGPDFRKWIDERVMPEYNRRLGA